MSIKLHFRLLFALLLAILGIVVAVFFISLSWEASSRALFGGIVGFVLVIGMFQYVIPARCPKCGQRARLELKGTYKYQCSACDHVHDTGISAEAD